MPLPLVEICPRLDPSTVEALYKRRVLLNTSHRILLHTTSLCFILIISIQLLLTSVRSAKHFTLLTSLVRASLVLRFHCIQQQPEDPFGQNATWTHPTSPSEHPTRAFAFLTICRPGSTGNHQTNSPGKFPVRGAYTP